MRLASRRMRSSRWALLHLPRTVPLRGKRMTRQTGMCLRRNRGCKGVWVVLAMVVVVVVRKTSERGRWHPTTRYPWHFGTHFRLMWPWYIYLSIGRASVNYRWKEVSWVFEHAMCNKYVLNYCDYFFLKKPHLEGTRNEKLFKIKYAVSFFARLLLSNDSWFLIKIVPMYQMATLNR